MNHLVPKGSLDPSMEGFEPIHDRGVLVLKKASFSGVRILRVGEF